MYRIKNISNRSKEDLRIVSDIQTISIFKEAFLFLGYENDNIHWKSNFLTACITLNSIIMRIIAIIRMFIVSSKLPKEYFYKHVSDSFKSIAMTMPERRPMDFFSSCIQNLINLILFYIVSEN